MAAYTTEHPTFAMSFLTACALNASGRPVCWNYLKDVKPPPTPTIIEGQKIEIPEPTIFDPPDEVFKFITAGNAHFCGLRQDGVPVCWLASDGWGFDSIMSPPEGETFTFIDSRRCYTCGIRPDGTPLCWPQFMDDDTCPEYKMVEPPANEKFTALTGGHGISCGLRANGTFLCYPDIEGVTEQDLESLPEPGESERFKAIDLAGWSFCAIRTDGSPTCWYWDMTGNQYTRNAREPAINDMNTISVGHFHACGTRGHYNGVCWWVNEMPEPHTWPDDLVGVHVITGNGHHSCGLWVDSSRICWTGMPDTP